jgi:predicted AlkP superfamily phosphohydrolase/phosphomutase
MTARVLGSAALAASLLAAAVVILTLYLNPALELRREAPALVASLFAPYLAGATTALFVLALAAAALRGWPREPRPVVEGLPAFAPLALVALAAATALFFANLFYYRFSIPEPFVRALAASAVALALSTLVLLAALVDNLLFPQRGRGVAAALVVLACASAVVVPLALRPEAPPASRPQPLSTETIRPVRQVVLVGVDGLGPRQLREETARGRLSAFARIARKGASGPLATFRPAEGPPIWTTIMTGRLPRDHGVKSFVSYRLLGSATSFELLPTAAFVSLLERTGLVGTTPVTAEARRRRALWNILNAFGIATGVVRVWGTQPPEHVHGFMVSHYFHLLRHDADRAGATLHPPDLLPEVLARAVDAADVDPALVAQFVDPQSEVLGDRLPWRRELVARGLAPDLTYQRVGAMLRKTYDPPFFATYFYGLDVVGHAFRRYAEPDRFGDVGAAEARRYGRVVERYAEQISSWIGELAAEAQAPGSGRVLVVVSGYGMDAVPLWRWLLGSLVRDSWASGTHAGAPDGVLMAVGDGIREGAALHDASVLDLAPTLLYLLGLPVAADMEGRVLTELVVEEFARAHPVSFIPSYESLAVTPMAEGGDAELPPLPEEEP